MIEKKMAYRIYKKQFSDCQTLNDYESGKITVLIPDDDVRIQRNKRINSKIWNSYNNEWRLKAVDERGCFLSFRVQKDETGYTAWYEAHDKGTTTVSFIKTREEALNIVLKKWEEWNN